MADHPMTRIDPRIPCTDPRFVPTPAGTDIRKTFARAFDELASGEARHWPQRYEINNATE